MSSKRQIQNTTHSDINLNNFVSEDAANVIKEGKGRFLLEAQADTCRRTWQSLISCSGLNDCLMFISMYIYYSCR